MTEAVEFCRQCHRSAPFCFYNGNTFVAIIRDCISHAEGFNIQQITLAKSLAGHMVAGTADPEEIRQFEKLLQNIENGGGEGEQISSKVFSAGDRAQTPKGSLTGIVLSVNEDESITWICDQTGAVMTGTARTLKPYSADIT